MHDLRMLCCYRFVNLNEIQDIIFHNLYIFNKCRIFACCICLICLTVVLFFWIVIVVLIALIDFVLSFNVIELKQAYCDANKQQNYGKKVNVSRWKRPICENMC